MPATIWTFLFSNLAAQLPTLIVLGVGLVLALRRRQALGAVAVLLVIALSAWIVLTLGAHTASAALIARQLNHQISLQNYAMWNAVISIGSSLIGALLWILVIAAIFIKRKPRAVPAVPAESRS